MFLPTIFHFEATAPKKATILHLCQHILFLKSVVSSCVSEQGPVDALNDAMLLLASELTWQEFGGITAKGLVELLACPISDPTQEELP